MSRRKNPWRREYPRPVWWVALSPDYDAASSGEPPEFGRDVLFIWAQSAHRAKVLAIRRWRRGWWRGLITNRKAAIHPQPYVVQCSDENPLGRVTIERVLIAKRSDATTGAPRE